MDLVQYWQCVYSLQNDAINNTIPFEELNSLIVNCIPQGYYRESMHPDIDESKEKSAFKGYYNLNERKYYVEYDAKESCTMEFNLIAATGAKPIMLSRKCTKGANELVIPLSSIAAGLYLIRISAAGNNLTDKIVIK